MKRFYSNENFPLPVVEELRRLGHDVLTVLESGNAGQRWPDLEVLRFAVSQQRAVLTLNRGDFIKLHQADPAHSGIVVCTVDADFIGQALRINESVEPLETLKSQLIRVNRPPR